MKTITLKSGREIELNQAFNMDCLEFMKELPDKCIDLVLTDPPYGLPKRSAKGSGKLKDRNIQGMHEKGWDIKPEKELFDEIIRISKHQIIWGWNYFTDHLPPCRGFLVWQKKQPWPNFADCELAFNSIDGVAKSYEYDNRTGDKIHPTQKPIKLFKWCLSNFTKEDQIIFDPYLGSFTTAVASETLKLNWLGCELDKDYFETGYARYEQETKQQLFDFGG